MTTKLTQSPQLDQSSRQAVVLGPPTRKSRALQRIARSGMALSRAISDRGWIGVWGTVEHTGRTSGRRYRTPVAVLSSGEFLLVPVPFGGATHWARNVLAAGGCVIRWRGRDTPVTGARLAEWPEVRSLTPRILRPVVRLAGIRTFLVAHR